LAALLEVETREDVLAHPEEFSVGDGGREWKSTLSYTVRASAGGEGEVSMELNSGELEPLEVADGGPRDAERAATGGKLGSSSLTSMGSGLSSSLLLGMWKVFLAMVLVARRVCICAAIFRLGSSSSGSSFSPLTAVGIA
jgi:hypothetical protein